MATGFTRGTEVTIKDNNTVAYAYRGRKGTVVRSHPYIDRAVLVEVDGREVGFEVRNLDLVQKSAADRLAELQAQVAALQAEVEEEQNKIVAKDLPVGSVIQLLVGLSRGDGNKSLLIKTKRGGWNMVKGSDDETVWIPRVYSDQYVQKWLDERVKREAKVVSQG